MSRYTGPKVKLSRRLGISLSGSAKDLKRKTPPGQHGPNQSRKKISGYGLQLREKQKLRLMYGLSEKQFRNLYEKTGKLPGKHGENFMITLETRLDNLVYRIGFGSTRPAARQLVSHGHITVNGKKVDIASYLVNIGDVIGLRANSRDLEVVKASIEGRAHVPSYLEFDASVFEGKLTRLPGRDELSAEIDETQIVEFYSR
jgi:small subunit ribosomal protein S4